MRYTDMYYNSYDKKKIRKIDFKYDPKNCNLINKKDS